MLKRLINFRVVFLRPPNISCACIYNTVDKSLNFSRFLHNKCNYNKKSVKPARVESVKQLFLEKLNMNHLDSERIIKSNNSFLYGNINDIVDNINVLLKFKVTPDVIRDNIWVLTIRPGELYVKLEDISTAHFKHIDHSVPFLKTSMKRFKNMCQRIRLNVEEEHTNRLYFLSEKLNMDPYIIAKSIKKRTFIYFLCFKQLHSTLTLLLDIGVKSEQIVNDWWVVRYSTRLIKEKFGKTEPVVQDNFKTWMVRCPKEVLDRSLDINITTKTLLSEDKSVQSYMAKRLKCSTENIEEMAMFAASIRKIRVKKANDVIDYLLSMGYTESDIIVSPRVFAHSLKTIKNRLEELCNMGMRPNNLHAICRASRQFRKYAKSVSKSKDYQYAGS